VARASKNRQAQEEENGAVSSVGRCTCQREPDYSSLSATRGARKPPRHDAPRLVLELRTPSFELSLRSREVVLHARAAVRGVGWVLALYGAHSAVHAWLHVL